MDRRIKSPGELGNRLQAPVLGVIPKFRGGGSPDRSLVVITEPRGSVSEAYRTAAIALENLAGGTGAQMIMFASPREGGGASTTTANIGAVLAQAGHQVIRVWQTCGTRRCISCWGCRTVRAVHCRGRR